MKLLVLFLLSSLLVSCGVVSDIASSVDAKKAEIREDNAVTSSDALKTLSVANQSNSFNQAIFQQSVAQVVFPKIVKAGLIVGANYGEGFLVRNNNVVALIDVAGGNLGIQAGAQQYSQVTYILDERRYREIIDKNLLSLKGSISYAMSGQIQNSLLTTDALLGGLYTVTFNETGTVFGASVEGLYYTIRK